MGNKHSPVWQHRPTSLFMWWQSLRPLKGFVVKTGAVLGHLLKWLMPWEDILPLFFILVYCEWLTHWRALCWPLQQRLCSKLSQSRKRRVFPKKNNSISRFSSFVFVVFLTMTVIVSLPSLSDYYCNHDSDGPLTLNAEHVISDRIRDLKQNQKKRCQMWLSQKYLKF